MPTPRHASFVPDARPKSFIPDTICEHCQCVIPASKPMVRLRYRNQVREYCAFPCFDTLRTRFGDMLTERIGAARARRIVSTLPDPIPAQP